MEGKGRRRRRKAREGRGGGVRGGRGKAGEEGQCQCAAKLPDGESKGTKGAGNMAETGYRFLEVVVRACGPPWEAGGGKKR